MQSPHNKTELSIAESLAYEICQMSQPCQIGGQNTAEKDAFVGISGQGEAPQVGGLAAQPRSIASSFESNAHTNGVHCTHGDADDGAKGSMAVQCMRMGVDTEEGGRKAETVSEQEVQEAVWRRSGCGELCECYQSASNGACCGNGIGAFR